MSVTAKRKAEFQQPEAKKEWIAPELKKIDVDRITAFGPHAHNDGFDAS